MTSSNGEWSVPQVVRQGTYRWFTLAYFLDELCNAVWLVTLGWIIAGTHSDWASAGILLATGVPLAFVLILCSNWVDRHTSRKVALITLALRAVVMIAWIVVVHTGAAPFATVAAIGALIGVISGVHEPAMTTYPIALLPADGQASAVVVERGTQRLSQAVGGIVAGYLLGQGGISAPAVAGAVAVVVALGILFQLSHIATPQTDASNLATHAASSDSTTSEALPDPAPAVSAVASSSDAAPVRRIKGGFDFVRAHPVLSRTLFVQAAITVAMAVVLLVTLPFRARQDGWSGQQYGATITAFGIGMTIATLVGFALQSRPERTRLVLACAMATVSGLCVVTLGVVSNWTTDLVVMAALGLSLGPAGPFLSGYLRSVTAKADDEGGEAISGRVTAVMILATDALEPLGFVVGIALAAFCPVAVPTVLMGGACTLVALWALGHVVHAPLQRPVGTERAV
ncbi:MFS transporter [Rudaeicoccus suwonensis]|uniref:MFS transporter n=1 Tax=Rudaeicoccus suwonensis TaxID=657409 RepID=A0A561E723_9MICO|nr:MFS transporter [Rudaeicoccus suwonensis]TWE11417.1 MFS transporter [Rudaeicoccus suwonensis]